MRVSLDGGVTWLEAPEGVRVDFDMQTDDDPKGTMTVNFTAEGMIVDQWAGPEVDEACIDTAAIMYGDLPEFFFGSTP